MKKLMKVEGMHCGGCSGRLKRILEALPGVTEAGADHADGTAYVVGDRMELEGILTIDTAIKNRSAKTIEGLYITNLPTTTQDTLISDILPMAAEAKFPIAVLDQDGGLRGIVTKAAVLSSMI